jgi:dihydrofolate reductase
MRKIIVLSMITLDGVLQAPGGPEEDPSNGFSYGGWVAPYGDEVGDKVVQKELKESADYLLGRKTYDIWVDYWPKHGDFWPGINEGTKYVLSTTLTTSDWKNTVFLESLADIEKLKQSEGADLQVWGSGELIQLLLEHDLVDELRLKIYPQIKKYITSQPEPKRSDMQALHRIILEVMPACKLWFLDGKDSENKTVSNPNIGYGSYTIKYADGTTREFYQIGMSANTTGISVYILGINDKTYLAQTYGKK